MVPKNPPILPYLLPPYLASGFDGNGIIKINETRVKIQNNNINRKFQFENLYNKIPVKLSNKPGKTGRMGLQYPQQPSNKEINTKKACSIICIKICIKLINKRNCQSYFFYFL